LLVSLTLTLVVVVELVAVEAFPTKAPVNVVAVTFVELNVAVDGLKLKAVEAVWALLEVVPSTKVTNLEAFVVVSNVTAVLVALVEFVADDAEVAVSAFPVRFPTTVPTVSVAV